MDTQKMPSPRELQLLALIVRERNGREIAKLFEQETGSRIPYGTVYTVLGDMVDAGWASSKDQSKGDRRGRLFQIRGPGVKALNRGRDYYLRLARFGTSDDLERGGRRSTR